MTQSHPSDSRFVHQPSKEFVESTNVFAFMEAHDIASYDELIERTTTDIDWFWDEVVVYLDIRFEQPYTTVRDDTRGPQWTKWYPGGELNIAHNVVHRHTDTGQSIACIWEAEDGDVRTLTFDELARQTNQVANVLESRGIGVGDTVALYMPMVPEVIPLLYGCFACGAIAVPIFSGFGTEAVATRLADAEATVLFTADGFYRRGEVIGLKETADEAIEQTAVVEHTVVIDRLGSTDGRGIDISLRASRDEWWHETVDTAATTYSTKSLPSSAASLLLYSSGTTGMPKGIVHTHAGALIQAAKEIYFGFDLTPDDRFFWVSDIGWMMGPWMLLGVHTFGGTVCLYEGAPDYPNPARFWEMIERHEITHFGISPTAIRGLRQDGDKWVDGHDLSSLRVLGSTGEPWDPETWQWYYDYIGGGNTPIINISGGTEIMGCFLMPMPIQPLKPCSLGGPGLGMAIDIVDAAGNSIAETGEQGYLVARDSCPSMTKSLWSGDQRYLDEYWSTWDGLWDHGDWAQKDADGQWFLLGRADEVLTVAGRKVGPAEVESAAIRHDAVNQAAAVGVLDSITGTAITLYVVLEEGMVGNDSIHEDIRETIGEALGKPFRPQEIRFVSEFPKTQSGKIIRRAITAIANGEAIGNLSSIENPQALEHLRNRS